MDPQIYATPQFARGSRGLASGTGGNPGQRGLRSATRRCWTGSLRKPAQSATRAIRDATALPTVRYRDRVTAAESFPHHRPEAEGTAGHDLEPTPTWVDDPIAARRFPSPEEIRAALPAEQVVQFDAAFEAALRSARQTLRLDQLRNVLRVWRRQALLAERDPEGHRQMLASATEVTRTRAPRPGSVSWSELKGELGG